MKNKKVHGFNYSKNMPNFEVFRKNLLFPTIFECKHRVCSEKSYISTHQKAANYKFFLEFSVFCVDPLLRAGKNL